jgi:translation elongation factor EF-4
VGTLMELAQGRRGDFLDMKYLTMGRTTLVYEVPLAEVVTDFFDQMKSRIRGDMPVWNIILSATVRILWLSWIL